MDLSQFDDRCLEALSIAQAHAVRRGHSTVGEWHLLLALCEQEDGVTRRILAAAGCSAVSVARIFESQLEKMPSQSGTLTRIGADVEALLESARREASARESRRVSDFHLLTACVESETLGGELLRSQGITQAKIQRAREGSTPNATALRSSSWLSTYGRDITADAKRGLLDPVIGREKETQRAIQILLRRSKNNPLLVGEPGVGKTAMVEAIAARIAKGKVPRMLRGKHIVSVDLGLMVAGAVYRGMFEKRLKGVVKEAVRSRGQVILFFDEAHCLVGAGSAMDRSTDAANLLKPALARGELRVIAATTSQEYRSHFSKDPALERRFQPILLEEPSIDETVAVLRGLKPLYEKHHHVRVVDQALVAAARLSKRYLPDRRLPDKAIDLLDEAAAACGIQAKQVPEELASMERRIVVLENQGQRKRTPELEKELGELRTAAGWLRASWQQTGDADRVVRENDVARVAASWSGVPVTKLLEDETERLRQLETRLRSSVIGQHQAARLVARAVLRARAGVKAADRPIGFGAAAGRAQRDIEKHFSPELINRFDAIVGFRPLVNDDMLQIVELQTRAMTERLAGQGVRLNWSSAIKLWLAERGFDPAFGARPLRRLIETEVETELAEHLLEGGIEEDVTIDVRDGRVVVSASSLQASTRAREAMMTPPHVGS